MAGHSQFKNIMHRKGAQDAKRAKIFTKVLREITVSAKINPDASHNPRLRSAIQNAKALNIPKDKVQNAINKATSAANTEHFEEMRYEGFAPGNIGLIVEALTDNRNRTASEVRSSFTKYGGNLGETGSVNYMFTRIGLILLPKKVFDFESVFEAAINANASDCIDSDDHFEIITEPEMLHEVTIDLEKQFGEIESAQITWKPNLYQEVDLETAKSLMKLIDALEDCDDVQNVIGNYKLPHNFFDND
jgi:YebC/PmpR family DNA-binding regulatory protein